MLLLLAIVLCVSSWSQGHALGKARVLRDVIYEEKREGCMTPDLITGRCIAINECPALLQLTSTVMNRETINFLRKSTCGFDGKNPRVCCPIDNAPEPVASSTFTSPTVLELKENGTVTNVEGATAQPVILVPTPSDEIKSAIDQQYPVASFCGESKRFSGRILGGSEAEEGAWPWMALLLYKNQTTGAIYRGCSGVLVSNRHVLTSAYCIEKAELAKVRLGLHRWGVRDSFRDVLIQRIIPHEFYKKSTGQNDIAIIVLDEKIEFDNEIQPICVPTDQVFRRDDFVGESPWIVGWGSVVEGGPSSEVLRQVQLPIVSPVSCKEAYKNSPTYVIDNSVICAGVPEGGRDFCTIDAGGPLMLSVGSDGFDRYYLLGIISSGRGCGRPGFPGIYTRVSQYVAWLEPKLKAGVEAPAAQAPTQPDKKIIARAVNCAESEASDPVLSSQVTQPGR